MIVGIVAQDYYSSFMLQSRGPNQPDGGATLVGKFETIPAVAEVPKLNTALTFSFYLYYKYYETFTVMENILPPES